MKNALLIISSSLLLFACGGEEGSEKSSGMSLEEHTSVGGSSPQQPSREESATIAHDFTPVVVNFLTQTSSLPTDSGIDYSQQNFAGSSNLTTTQLSVPAEFNYHPAAQIDIQADISAIRTDRAFIAFYSQYSTSSNGTYQAVYESRITSSALTLGVANLSFSYPLSQSSLLAEIWFYDGSAPLQQIFIPVQP